MTVEWRTALGAVSHREPVATWSEARKHAWVWRLAYPTQAPWAVLGNGHEERLAPPTRRWDSEVQDPGPHRRAA